MSSLTRALGEPIEVPPAIVRPTREDVLVRLQALRAAQARRIPAGPGTRISVEHELAFDGWALSGFSPLPGSVQVDAKLVLSLPLVDRSLAFGLVGLAVGREYQFPSVLPPTFPLVEMVGSTVTQRVRVRGAAKLLLPSEDDPEFWKGTGLGADLKEIVDALVREAAREQLLAYRRGAVDFVLLSLAERMGIQLAEESLRAKKIDLFERWEKPRWQLLAAKDLDLQRLAMVWNASPTVSRWVAREHATATVVGELISSASVSSEGLPNVVELLTRPPPELASGDKGKRGALLEQEAARAAAWLEMGNRILQLPNVTWLQESQYGWE